MVYIGRAPAPPLDAFVASIWYCENDPRPFGLERVLPSGAAQLIINLKEDQTRIYHLEPGTMTVTSGTVLSGVASRYGLIDTAEQEWVAGVAFRPGGTAAFFRVPAHETLDASVPLEFLWERGRAAALREQLLEAASPCARLDILERAMADACRSGGLHPAVGFALREFAGRPDAVRIAAVADRAGLSPKRFIERFKESVGVSPKHFCRILRFQRALARMEEGRQVNWTRIAVDCGYFDQAHFIHDFRSFAGITPTGYEAGRTQFRNHVKFLQSDSVAEMR
jgi:AraC-like DNA-binding protein